MEPTTKKKKLVEIAITGTEKCLEARDENDDCIIMFSRFSEDDLVFQVDGNEYSIENFAETDYGNEDFEGINEVDVAELFEGETWNLKEDGKYYLKADEDATVAENKIKALLKEMGQTYPA